MNRSPRKPVRCSSAPANAGLRCSRDEWTSQQSTLFRCGFQRALPFIVSFNFVSCGGDTPPDDHAATRICTACEIVLTRVGVMSDSANPGSLPDETVYAERDKQGRLYTVSRSRNSVLVFD
jgi:hypothetical protein